MISIALLPLVRTLASAQWLVMPGGAVNAPCLSKRFGSTDTTFYATPQYQSLVVDADDALLAGRGMLRLSAHQPMSLNGRHPLVALRPPYLP
jgi:hypothetical protein